MFMKNSPRTTTSEADALKRELVTRSDMNNEKNAGTATTTTMIVAVTNKFDIMLGRGKGANDREGNIQFRKLASEKAPEYMAQKNDKQKLEIAEDVMAQLETKGARFLLPVSATNANGDVVTAWQVAKKDVSLAKVRKVIRNATLKLKEQEAIEIFANETMVARWRLPDPEDTAKIANEHAFGSSPSPQPQSRLMQSGLTRLYSPQQQSRLDQLFPTGHSRLPVFSNPDTGYAALLGTIPIEPRFSFPATYLTEQQILLQHHRLQQELVLRQQMQIASNSSLASAVRTLTTSHPLTGGGLQVPAITEMGQMVPPAQDPLNTTAGATVWRTQQEEGIVKRSENNKV